MVNKKAIELFLVYLGVVTLAISQPLFNVVTLYRRNFDMSLMDVILIIVVFQYALTGVLMGFRRLFWRGSGIFDFLVFLGLGISLARQFQQMHLSTVFLSGSEKYLLVVALVAIPLVIALFFRKWTYKILVPVGVISPLFGFHFLYAVSQHVLPLSFPDSMPVASKEAGPPIYLILLDELSLPLIMNDVGEIDSKDFPNLSAFSKDSVWFRQSIAHHPFSEDSFVSIISGKYVIPKMNQVFVENAESIPERSLPRELISRGYAVNMYSNYFGCGAQEFDCSKYYSSNSPFFLWRVFENFVHTFGPDFILYRWMPFLHGAMFQEEHTVGLKFAINGHPGNLYIIHRMMSHAPYLYDRNGDFLFSPHLSLIPGVNFERTVENYREQLMYVDHQFGELVAALKESEMYDDAVIALTSDHGNCWRDECPGRIYVEKILVAGPELTRVPTMIRAPGLTPRVDDDDFQLVDVFPSVMDAAGMALKYEEELDGRSGLRETRPLRIRPFFQFPSGPPLDVGLPARAVRMPNFQ